MTAVYFHKRGFNPSVRFLVVKGETVRECGECRSGDGWVNDLVAGSLVECPRHKPTTRTIPASLPDFEVVCPECIGPPFSEGCKRCLGSGVVLQVAHAEPQWRHWIDGDWGLWHTDCGRVERLLTRTEERQAIVAVSDLRVLPVVDRDDDHAARGDEMFPCIVVYRDLGQVVMYHSIYDRVDISSEPWAQGLAPGDTVLALGEPRLLDEPIVEMLCACGNGCSRCDGYDAGRVPLALLPGLQSVEGVEIP